MKDTTKALVAITDVLLELCSMSNNYSQDTYDKLQNAIGIINEISGKEQKLKNTANLKRGRKNNETKRRG